MGRSRCYSFQTLNPSQTAAWLSWQGFRLIDGQKSPKPVHFLPRRQRSDLDSHSFRREALWQKLGDRSLAATSWRLLSARDNTPGALSQCLPQKYLEFHGIFQPVRCYTWVYKFLYSKRQFVSYGTCHSWWIDNDRVRSWKHGCILIKLTLAWKWHHAPVISLFFCRYHGLVSFCMCLILRTMVLIGEILAEVGCCVPETRSSFFPDDLT